ncbi:Ig-like domain-containing protein, partial [Methylobacterium sp. CCH5-D2]|uniref:Ig-like domain-containing protein n=1 Tax=Methylobacterium sp. CCH5-D2 TaxID=1768765 RepID=UPI001FD9D40F
MITTAPGSTSDTTPTITGTAEVGATVTIANNGTVLGTAIADANGAFSFTPAAPLPDETLSLTATAADALGNVSAASSPVTLTIDTSPPAAPDLAALPDATNDTTPLITGTAEAGTTVTLLNNGVPIGTALADADGRFSLTPGTPLTGGANSLTATATDAAGNTGTASSPVTLTVDLLAPGAPVLTAFPNPTNDTTPTITGAAEAGATVTIASNGTTLGTVVAGTDGAFSFTPTTALAEGANSLTATATDAAGNVSLAAQTPLRVDLTPPPAPAVDPLPATTGDTTPTITGTAKAGATVTVLNGNVVLGTVVAGAGGAFSFTPTTPLPVGTASLTATATDVAGNTGPASATIVLEITPPPVAGDTTPPDAPVLTAFPNPTNESQPAITGTAEAGATVTIASNGAEIGSVVAGPSGTFSFTPTTSLPEGANTLTATATDAAG